MIFFIQSAKTTRKK